MVVLAFPSHDISVLLLFAGEVSTVATAICGLANTNTLLKVKFELGNSDACAHQYASEDFSRIFRHLGLMLDSPREGLLLSMEMVTASPSSLIVPISSVFQV